MTENERAETWRAALERAAAEADACLTAALAARRIRALAAEGPPRLTREELRARLAKGAESAAELDRAMAATLALDDGQQRYATAEGPPAPALALEAARLAEALKKIAETGDNPDALDCAPWQYAVRVLATKPEAGRPTLLPAGPCKCGAVQMEPHWGAFIPPTWIEHRREHCRIRPRPPNASDAEWGEVLRARYDAAALAAGLLTEGGER